MPTEQAMELDRQQHEELQRRLNALAHAQSHSLFCSEYECVCNEPLDTLFEDAA